MTHYVLARFESEDALVAALTAIRARGLDAIDAACPYPSQAIEDALGAKRTRITWLAFAASAVCGFLAWLILWWTNAYQYRLDVGGRPYHSFWTDVPITFETMILSSGLVAFFAFFVASGLPRLNHPWLGIADFADGFWISIDTADPVFDERVTEALRGLGASRIEEVS